MVTGALRGSLERNSRATQNADRALGELMRILGDIYVFGVDGHGRWVALRRDGRAALIADSPESLATAIRDDCRPRAEGGDDQ